MQICCIITWKSRFSHDATESKVYILCIITIRSSVYHYAPKILYLVRYFHLKLHKICIFDAISSEKAGFIMTRPKCAYFMHYYVEKQVFSWQAKKRCIFVTFLRVEAGFLKILKTRCISVALLRWKAGFSLLRKKVYLMQFCVKSCQRCVYSMQFTWTSRISHDATEKLMTIWCIVTFKSRFSHDTPKTFIFGALLCGKAGFLMMHQKLIYVYWCIITRRSSFSHGTPNYQYICYIFSLKTTFYRNAKDKKRVYLINY